ncbi:HAMP domain-containing histidine kinase [Actinoallomurus spadix]|uniref:histidine kinase n=1 Tax=Actinoallomurus spadix TaxID=79912 RepID=A0ABN0X676_9ACTN|nr:HAMP domain-containing sensor histidine kinase [Actinoallomurus spadix]MCO5986940.1 HAMP domain-containing histidine kinase [Actinoallomurus spadix]
MTAWARRLSARTPLRIKLIAAVVTLVLLALVVTGVASVSVMRDYLLDRTDLQLQDLLHRAERSLAQPAKPLPGQGAGTLVQIRDADGKVLKSTTVSPWGTVQPDPAIPENPDWLDEHAQRPITLRAVSGDVRWRVYVEPVGTGYVVAAADLTEVGRTVRRFVGVELIVGSVVVVLIAGLGIAIVRASLRSLEDIEHTAAAIATGDLSRRVPDADPRTEVGRLGDALNGMLAQIETAFHAQARSEATARESEERMRRFVADASHELRTPLSVIRGFAEYYRQRDDVDRAELDRLIARVEDEAVRMGALVDDLLLLARLDQQRPLAMRPVDLLALAAEAVHDARVLDADRKITLSVRSGSAFIVTGDELRLRQVIRNLLTNALQHTQAGTPVEVTVHSGRLGDAPAAVLEVADQGQGMPREQAERVFERFYRADPARSRGGTGLGLAIVAGLVHAHGGTVEVETAPGKGATFLITLPLDPDAIDADPAETVSA